MNATILFFGRLGEQLGRQRDIDLPSGGCTIAELRQRLVDDVGEAASCLLDPTIRASVDQVITTENQRVNAGQEIAFLSPLSGG